MRAAEAFGHDVDSGLYVYVLRRPHAAEYVPCYHCLTPP